MHTGARLFRRTTGRSTRPMSRLTFETLDVFTTQPFGGNPLAVVYGAEGLGSSTLQRIAREFNLSETTFVLPPESEAHTACVRIFTPTAELPFAGHPNIGTAYALGRRGTVFGRQVGTSLTFEEGAGVVPVTLRSDGSAQLDAPMPFALSAAGEGVRVEKAAACLGLEACDVRSEGRVVALGGSPYTVVELASLSALVRCTPDYAEVASTPPGKVLAWVECDEGDEVDLRCRMFAGRGAEDAATGAANCCLLGLLATLGRHDGLRDERSGSLSRRIAQGVEMGRPSLLVGECDHTDGAPTAVRIAGSCVPISTGEFVVAPSMLAGVGEE